MTFATGDIYNNYRADQFYGLSNHQLFPEKLFAMDHSNLTFKYNTKEKSTVSSFSSQSDRAWTQG